MSGPCASVLLPVRGGAWLAEALESLLAQTRTDFEVCLQLDGADGIALETASRFARADARVLVESMPALGIVHALGAAARRARADLFVRMDADDRCEPERLARLVEKADAHPGVGFFASRIAYFPRESVGEGLARYERWINGVLGHDDIVANRFVECPLPHPAWAVRRAVFDALDGYRDGPFPEDYDFFLRAVDAGVVFRKVPEVLLHWRNQPERLSRTDPRYALHAFFALKTRYLASTLRSEVRPVWVSPTGRAGRRWVRRLGAEGIEVAGLLDACTDRGLLSPGEAFVLIAVGPGERDAERLALQERDFVEGVDFLCVQ